MSQHFLLSSAAKTLSVKAIVRMTEEEAYQMFRQIRWSANSGEPCCPRCGCVTAYAYTTRKLWKCKGCHHQFSVTSGTLFANRKMEMRDILMAIAIFVNGAKGVSALQISRDLECQYRTAFVLCHKIREAMAAEDIDATVSGEVEIDGAYFGGYLKPANHKENRRDRRLTKNQNGKRRVVVIARERNGKIISSVFKSEDASHGMIRQRVEPGSIIHADEASHWDHLHASFETMRINHSQAYSDGGACTNMAESFFSRLRRAEIGTHHHIAGPYLASYAAEMDWREDHRRKSNGEQFNMVLGAALAHKISRQWKGYWQRGSG